LGPLRRFNVTLSRRSAAAVEVPGKPQRAGSLLQLMTVLGDEIQPINLTKLLDVLKRFCTEGLFVFEGMQRNAFDQIAKGDVQRLGESLEHFQDPLLDPYAGLHAFNGLLGWHDKSLDQGFAKQQAFSARS
jgi:hypothetical protein